MEDLPLVIAESHVDRSSHPKGVDLPRAAENVKTVVDETGSTEQSASLRWRRLGPPNDAPDGSTGKFDHGWHRK